MKGAGRRASGRFDRLSIVALGSLGDSMTNPLRTRNISGQKSHYVPPAPVPIVPAAGPDGAAHPGRAVPCG